MALHGQSLTVETRYKILVDVQNGIKPAAAAQKYGTSRQNVNKIIKASNADKEKILKIYESNPAPAKERKNLKGTEVNINVDISRLSQTQPPWENFNIPLLSSAHHF